MQRKVSGKKLFELGGFFYIFTYKRLTSKDKEVVVLWLSPPIVTLS